MVEVELNDCLRRLKYGDDEDDGDEKGRGMG